MPAASADCLLRRRLPALGATDAVITARLERGRAGPLWYEVCDYLDLGLLPGRRVHNPSGGVQQRVALGRALLAAPELLLLDEPLASLDNDGKEEIIPYLRTVISKLRIPAI